MIQFSIFKQRNELSTKVLETLGNCIISFNTDIHNIQCVETITRERNKVLMGIRSHYRSVLLLESNRDIITMS